MWFKPKRDYIDPRVEQLENEIKRYQDALVAERTLLARRCADASFEFDFNAVKVFSIERNTKDDVPVTIIGYILDEPIFHATQEMWCPNPKIREWYLYCSEERHEELVIKFRESMKNK